VPREWARRWPAEGLWKARKPGKQAAGYLAVLTLVSILLAL
jgi:hypothetical protein